LYPAHCVKKERQARAVPRRLSVERFVQAFFYIILLFQKLRKSFKLDFTKILSSRRVTLPEGALLAILLEICTKMKSDLAVFKKQDVSRL